MGLLWGVIDGLEWSKDSVREFWITLKREKGAHVLHPKKGKMQRRPLFHDVLGTGLLMVVLEIVPKDFRVWTCGPLMTAKVETTSLASKQRIKNPEKINIHFVINLWIHPNADLLHKLLCHLSTSKHRSWSWLTTGSCLTKSTKKCVLYIGQRLHGSTFQKKPFEDSPLTSQPRGQVVAVARKAQCLATQKHHEQTPKTCKTHQSSPSCRFNCYQFLLFLLV